LDNPIHIIVTTLSSPGGSGRISSFDSKNYFGQNERQRLRIKNSDKFCMFYACELARHWHDRVIIKQLLKDLKPIPESLITTRSFYNFRKNTKKQQQNVIKLMDDAGINKELDEYGLEHLQLLQTHYDTKYPGQYRIVLVDDSPEIKPVWYGPLGRKFVIAIYLENDHYDALKSIASFYGHRNYCPGNIL
jgi:hypothetical protein